MFSSYTGSTIGVHVSFPKVFCLDQTNVEFILPLRRWDHKIPLPLSHLGQNPESRWPDYMEALIREKKLQDHQNRWSHLPLVVTELLWAFCWGFWKKIKLIFVWVCYTRSRWNSAAPSAFQNYFVKIKSIPHGGLFVFIFKGFEQLMLILLWKN